MSAPSKRVAAGQLAVAQYFLGLPAFDTLDRAAGGMDALDDAELAGCLDVGRWIPSAAEPALERHERAIEHSQRVIDVARSTGQGAALLVPMTTQAWSLIRWGDWTRPRTAFRPRSRWGTSHHTSSMARPSRSRP